MGTTTTTSAVYIHVIEDVVNKVREEFINNGGPGESVLSELQGIWETKMMQAGVLNGPIERSSAQKPTPGGPLTHDLNVPYEGTEEYETPTAEMLFPPTPLQTPLPMPLPGTADNFIRDSNRADEDFCEFERKEDFVVEPVHLDSDLDADIEPIHVDPTVVLQNQRYDPTGDAYMLGIRKDIAEQLWISRS